MINDDDEDIHRMIGANLIIYVNSMSYKIDRKKMSLDGDMVWREGDSAG